jgi:hypothetical protein
MFPGMGGTGLVLALVRQGMRDDLTRGAVVPPAQSRHVERGTRGMMGLDFTRGLRTWCLSGRDFAAPGEL